MSTSVTATIVNGQLRLDQPLELPDHTRALVTIIPMTEVEGRLEAAKRFFALSITFPLDSGGERFRREDLYERD